MTDTQGLIICIVFVLIGVYNAGRAWHWTEVPEVLEGREHMIPMQIPGTIFFLTGPLLFALDVLTGHPANGSPVAILVGSIAGAVALTGLVLAATTSYLGRPRRLIAPIAPSRRPSCDRGRENAPDRRLAGPNAPRRTLRHEPTGAGIAVPKAWTDRTGDDRAGPFVIAASHVRSDRPAAENFRLLGKGLEEAGG